MRAGRGGILLEGLPGVAGGKGAGGSEGGEDGQGGRGRKRRACGCMVNFFILGVGSFCAAEEVLLDERNLLETPGS